MSEPLIYKSLFARAKGKQPAGCRKTLVVLESALPKPLHPPARSTAGMMIKDSSMSELCL